jgi:hypothetical protein
MKETAKNGAIFDWLAMLEDTGFTGQICHIASGHLEGDAAVFKSLLGSDSLANVRSPNARSGKRSERFTQ